MPLLLLAVVVTGAVVVALLRPGVVPVSPGDSAQFVGMETLSLRDPVRLLYWVIASVLAYLLTLWIARRQGYRRGLWVNRRPLVVAGAVALLVAVIVVVGWFAPADLLGRRNIPVLAIAVGIVVWAVQERRPGLWVLAVVTALLAVLANVYDVENLLLRLGMPNSDGTDEIANLGVVALALFVAAAVFGLRHIRDARALATRGAR